MARGELHATYRGSHFLRPHPAADILDLAALPLVGSTKSRGAAAWQQFNQLVDTNYERSTGRKSVSKTQGAQP